MKSIFITGTDTNIGKTYIATGLITVIRRMGINAGIMKPFAAAAADKDETPDKDRFKSKDAEILSDAANTSDPESMINPQFFPVSASPYTAYKNLGMKPDIPLVLENFTHLSRLYDMLLIEGMGGVMTPILDNYYIADLIKEMQTPAIIVIKNRIGTINHTIMTVKMCKENKIPVIGIIINDFDDNGYPPTELTRDLQDLLKVPVLGVVPFIKKLNDAASLYQTFKDNIDFKTLLNN